MNVVLAAEVTLNVMVVCRVLSRWTVHDQDYVLCNDEANSRGRAWQWCQNEYHQEYTPVAQLEAAMHLLIVMDSWMTRMLFR